MIPFLTGLFRRSAFKYRKTIALSENTTFMFPKAMVPDEKNGLIKKKLNIITISSPFMIVVFPIMFFITLPLVIYYLYGQIKIANKVNSLVRETLVLCFGKNNIEVYKNYKRFGEYSFQETNIRLISLEDNYDLYEVKFEGNNILECYVYDSYVIKKFFLLKK